jgi:hypothetical protein
VLAIAVVGIGFVPMFQYETEFNEPYLFALRHLAIPVLLAVYIIPFVWRRWLPGFKFLAVPAILGLMFLLWVSQLLLWPNALLGAQRSETVDGQVIRRFVAGAKSRSYVVAIERLEQHDTVRLRVPKQTFDAVTLGSRVRTDMTRGSLGLLYRRR